MKRFAIDIVCRVTVLCLFTLSAIALAGCSSTATDGNTGDGSSGDGRTYSKPASTERTKLTDANDSDEAVINAHVQEQVERLKAELDAMRQSQAAVSRNDTVDRRFAEANGPVIPNPENQPQRKIQFVAPDSLGKEVLNPNATNQNSTDTAATNTANNTKHTPPTDSKTELVANPAPIHEIETKTTTTEPAKFDPSTLDRKTLMKLLIEKTLESKDPNNAMVIAIAGLALADRDGVVDPLRIEGLKPSERQLVQQFQSLFTHVSQKMAKGQPIDKANVIDQINSIIGEQPLSIRKVKLCSRVRGYGVFTEMPSTTLLAGREHPFIVYAELDNFAVKQSDKHLYNQQVSLSQELVLYNAVDGLAVWRQPEQLIVDESRNRRRDFFTVQPSRLPARLGPGKYVLKVRVRDKHAGTRAEESIDINVVADPSLVKPNVSKTDRKG